MSIPDFRKSLGRLQENLAEYNILKRELKARSRIFDCEAKEKAALFFNRPMKFYYHFSFNRWIKIKRIYFNQFLKKKAREK